MSTPEHYPTPAAERSPSAVFLHRLRSPSGRNMGWLAGERGIQILLGGVASILIVRFLGPVNYGTYSFALALVTLVLTATQLPIPLIVHDLVVKPEAEAETMGTATLLATLLVASGLAMLAITTLFLGPLHDRTTFSLVLIFATALLFRPAVTIDAVFQAELRARHATLARNIGFSAASFAQLWVVATRGSMQALAAATLLNPLLTGILFVALYARGGRSLRRWRIHRDALALLAKRSVPLMIATTAVAIYMGIDQVMLGLLSSRAQLGIYSATVTLSGAAYFLPVIFVSSLAPGLTTLRLHDREEYSRRLSEMYAYLAAGALTVIVGCEIFGSRLAITLFGAHFREVGSVLSVHILSLLFVCFGVGDSTWTVNQGLERLSMYRTLAGAAVNVGLNLLFLPTYGAIAAAWATTVSYAVAATAGDAFHRASRPYFMMQLRALNPVRWIAVIIRTNPTTWHHK